MYTERNITCGKYRFRKVNFVSKIPKYINTIIAAELVGPRENFKKRSRPIGAWSRLDRYIRGSGASGAGAAPEVTCP